MTVLGTVEWIVAATVAAFLVVEMIVAWSAFRRPSDAPGPLKGFSRRRFEAAWMLTPAVILIGLVFWTSRVLGHDVRIAPGEPDLSVTVTGHRYYWEIHYTRDGHDVETTSNQLHLPAGKLARIDVGSADVVHGFWVPELGLKESVAPGSTHTLWVRPTEAGEFNIVCAELCGESHFAMRGFVHVESDEAFAGWIAAQEKTPAVHTASVAR